MSFDKSDFIDTFKAESDENLAIVSRNLLALEQGKGNKKELIVELFRAAHSLKGAAALMGFDDIRDISHRMEDVMSRVKAGKVELGREVADALFAGIDGIGAIVAEIMGGAPSGVDVPGLVAVIEAAMQVKEQPGRANPGVTLAPQPPPQSPVEPEAPLPSPPPVEPPAKERRRSPVAGIRVPRAAAAVGGPQNLDTIRVKVEKLDSLLNMVGELVVTRIGFDEILADLENIKNNFATFEYGFSEFSAQVEEMMICSDTQEEATFGDQVKEQDRYLKSVKSSFFNFCEQVNQAVRILGTTSKNLQSEIMQVRMLPISVIFDTLPRAVRDIANTCNKKVEFVVEGQETELDKKIIEEIKAPLVHLIRNAIDHGIESAEERVACGKSPTGILRVSAFHSGNCIHIVVADDGHGLDANLIKNKALKRGLVTRQQLDHMSITDVYNMIFKEGFSTKSEVTAISGRGVGMDVVKENVTNLKGTIAIESELGAGCSIDIKLPLTLAIIQSLLIISGGEIFAVPLSSVEETRKMSRSDLLVVEAREAIQLNERIIPLVRLSEILNMPKRDDFDADDQGNIVVVGAAEERLAILVEAFISKKEIVSKSMGRALQKVKNIAGATLLGDGSVALILDINSIVESARESAHTLILEDALLEGASEGGGSSEEDAEAAEHPQQGYKLLVVDDSLSIREMERNILESCGYLVDVAIDGSDAFRQLEERHYDMVITDVDMPLMNGIELTRNIRASEQLKLIPVVMITSKYKEEDQRAGFEAGANYYIVKSEFDESKLIEVIESLIGT